MFFISGVDEMGGDSWHWMAYRSEIKLSMSATRERDTGRNDVEEGGGGGQKARKQESKQEKNGIESNIYLSKSSGKPVILCRYHRNPSFKTWGGGGGGYYLTVYNCLICSCFIYQYANDPITKRQSSFGSLIPDISNPVRSSGPYQVSFRVSQPCLHVSHYHSGYFRPSDVLGCLIIIPVGYLKLVKQECQNQCTFVCIYFKVRTGDNASDCTLGLYGHHNGCSERNKVTEDTF